MTTPAPRHDSATFPPPLPVDADPTLGPLLDRFLACVCAELAAAERPVCECCLVWGDSIPPADFCDCACGDGHGQAWVRVVRWDPANTTNRLDNKKCQTLRTRVWLEAGVYRCVASVAPDGQSAPTCEQRSADAWGLIRDAMALRQAFACCEALNDRVLEFMSEEPTGMQGGCSGVVIQFTVDV